MSHGAHCEEAITIFDATEQDFAKLGRANSLALSWELREAIARADE